MTQLIINGQPRCFSFPDQTPVNSQSAKSPGNTTMTVSQLLGQMGLQGKRIAVERNGEIVPRSKFDQPILADGDSLEIVVAVGGG